MKIVLRRDLKTRFGIPFSNKHLLHLEREGKFPQRFSIVPGGKVKGYDEAEIEQHQAHRHAERDRGPAA